MLQFFHCCSVIFYHGMVIEVVKKAVNEAVTGNVMGMGSPFMWRHQGDSLLGRFKDPIVHNSCFECELLGIKVF